MALTKVTGSVIKDSVSLSGNVSVGGTLTYQDVTNVDALGVGTFRSGINVSGGQLDVGSNVKIGNAGIVTASNFKTGVTNLHSTGLTLTGGQLDVGSNIKVGTAGVVTATSFVGSGANLTGIDATKIITGNTQVQTIDTGSDGHIKFTTEGTEKVRINSSGHMGLGVTPNTNWPTNADFKALQIGTGACVFGRGSGDEDRGGIAVNWYSTGSANKYIGNGNAARIYLADGNIYFANAGANSSGANAAMTITDRMVINVNGDIGVNCTPLGSDPFKLDVANNTFNVARFVRSGGTAGVRIEGNGATEGVYLSLKNLNNTANSGCVIEGVDADGNGTTWIKLSTENHSTNAGAISLHTRPAGGSTTERFRINSNGQVTQPAQPSFAAYRNVDGYSLNNEVFPFNATRHNIGSHFNTGNYRFTAPVAGRYIFTFHSILNSQVNSGHYSFRVNNSTSYGHNVHFTTTNSHWDHVSSSQIMNLSANDYVTLWSNSNIGWHGNGWQIFCGELLS